MSASKLQFTPCSTPIQGNEINFSKLYLHHTPAGPRPNQSGVTSTNKETGLGSLVVNNWQVYHGIGCDAKVVAHAQGLHVYAGNWHNSFTLVFEDERFKGSTLEVMGIVVEQGEWAIVGGTGQFAMANGVIFKKFHEQKKEGNIMVLTIKGFCPVLKGSPSQGLVTKIGPWGGIDGGRAQDITATPKRQESITIHSGWTIDSISFIYFDQAGEKHRAGPWGGPGGDPCTIEFGSSEFLKEVSGTFGPYEG
uniref:Dirigent protein n=1 Tax=Oryza meridionalis TaxID=40149 RepID=A0A0E0DGA2_9ORYZ